MHLHRTLNIEAIEVKVMPVLEIVASPRLSTSAFQAKYPNGVQNSENFFVDRPSDEW